MGYALVGVDDDPVADFDGAVRNGLGAERLDDAGHLEARVEGGVAHALVRRGGVERQVERLVRRDGRQRRDGRVAVQTVAGAGARHPDAGAARRHFRHRHLEAEHAVFDGRPRRLDAHLPAQLVHRDELKSHK